MKKQTLTAIAFGMLAWVGSVNAQYIDWNNQWNSSNTSNQFTNGKVGIGGDLPTGFTKRLFVNGEALFTVPANGGGKFSFSRPASTDDLYLTLGTSNGIKWHMGMDDTDGGNEHFRILRTTMMGTPTEFFINGQNGYFGLGTATPAAKLHVNGTGIFNSNVGIGTSAPSQRLQIDNGHAYIRGTGNFMNAGNEATLYLGDTWNYIRSVNGTGVQIGCFGADANNNPVSINAITVYNHGRVAIGNASTFTNIPTTNNNYKLYVQGGILTEEVKVAVYNSSAWADFVFDKAYKLRALSEVESFIKENKHLPEIPSADEVVEKGVNLAEMDAKLLMKIEELTLYMIEMDKKIKKLETENTQLRSGSSNK